MDLSHGCDRGATESRDNMLRRIQQIAARRSHRIGEAGMNTDDRLERIENMSSMRRNP